MNSLTALQQSKLWAAKPESFNDPFEFRLKKNSQAKGFEEFKLKNIAYSDMTDEGIIKEICSCFELEINKMGVISFTLCSKNILMWSHYADNHYGMCLEFSSDDLNESGVYPVKYSSAYPDIDFERIWHEDGLAKILWTKSEEWSYEKELRLITTEGGKLTDYKFELTGIIFGCRTPDRDIALVKSILKDRDIKYQRARLAEQEFRIELDPE